MGNPPPLPLPRPEAPATWSIQRLLRWTADHFATRGLDSPRLTAEVLLAHALGVTRLRLYLDFDRPLEAAELGAFRDLVRRRAEGVPTQQLVGGREFHGHWFAVDGRVFIPRPETELLVDACLSALPGDGAGARVLDLCAGSGCVGLSLALERPAARVDAVELSPDACAVARQDAAALGAGDRWTLRCGDLFAPLPAEAVWQVIAANPPYVPTGTIPHLAVEVRDHEPRLALDGGPDGLAVVRRIVREGAGRLAPGGLMALEIGEGQAPAVQTLFAAAGLSPAAPIRDPAGHERIVTARSAAAGSIS